MYMWCQGTWDTLQPLEELDSGMHVVIVLKEKNARLRWSRESHCGRTEVPVGRELRGQYVKLQR